MFIYVRRLGRKMILRTFIEVKGEQTDHGKGWMDHGADLRKRILGRLGSALNE